MEHQKQLYFPSESPWCSGWLCWLWRNLVPSDIELHASRRPGDGSCCILTSNTIRLVYGPAERHVCYTLRRGCSCAIAVQKMSGDDYALLRLIATFYLAPIDIYRIPHSPYICLALTFCHIAIQSYLRIPRLPLHLLRHYHTIQVWNIQPDLHTL